MPAPPRHQLLVDEGADGQRLDRILADALPLSRNQLANLVRDGHVVVDGRTARRPSQSVRQGQTVVVEAPPPEAPRATPQDIPLRVIFEDADVIVVDKAPGMVVHPAPGSPDGTLVNALLHHCGDSLSGVGGVKRPGIVHRIDKDTSGLLVVAKSDAAHRGLAAQFEAHEVERYYRAICYGVPDASDPRLRGVRGASFEPGNILKLTTGLARHRSDRQKQAVVFEGGRHAITRVRVVEPFGTPAAAALVECWLETGRTHQIRVHMAHAGHGLIGDPAYGGRRLLPERALGAGAVAAASRFARQALHTAVLGFEHPLSGARLRFESPMPADMAGLVAALRGG